MTRVLLLGDIHLSDRPPSSCTDSYNDDIFAILEHTAAIAAEERCTAVVWAGDIFHHKTPGRTSHGTVMRTIELARKYPCPLWIVPGNHDLTHDRLDSITRTQPLGVLFASGAATLLDGWMPGERVYGVPWLGQFTDDTVTDALEPVFGLHKHTDSQALVVTHAPLYPPGQELKYEYFKASDWADAMGNRGFVYYGHIHEPHGVYTVNGVTFANPGAISRGSLHEHNLTRTLQAVIFDETAGSVRPVDLPHKPPAEVFRLQEAQQARTAQRRLDDLLDAVGQTRLEVTSVESVMHHVNGLPIDDGVKAAVRQLLEHTG